MSSDLTLYAPPSSSELEQTWQLASKLARTEFVPKPMRGSPESVLACMLTGRELGIGPMQALRDVYLVNGKPSLSATLMVARVRAQGHRFRTLENTDHHATVQIHRKGEPAPEPPVTFSVEDAKRAKLISKDVWQQYPARMNWARAASACCRRDCPEVLGGAGYTREELEDGDPETETTWGEVEVNHDTGEVTENAGRLGGEDPIPAQPTGPSIPTLTQIEQLRTVRAAKELIYTSPPQFQALVPRAISALYQTDPHQWWDQPSKVDQWRQVLEYAVELADHEQHEMSGAAPKGPPAVQAAPDPTSDPSRQGEGRGGSDDPEGGGDG